MLKKNRGMGCASGCLVRGKIWIVLNSYKKGICGDNEEPKVARFFLTQKYITKMYWNQAL